MLTIDHQGDKVAAVTLCHAGATCTILTQHRLEMECEQVVHTSDRGTGQLIARWTFGGSNTVMCLPEDASQRHQVGSNAMKFYPREIEACVVVMDGPKKGRRPGAETAARSEARRGVITSTKDCARAEKSEGGDDYTTRGRSRGHKTISRSVLYCYCTKDMTSD